MGGPRRHRAGGAGPVPAGGEGGPAWRAAWNTPPKSSSRRFSDRRLRKFVKKANVHLPGNRLQTSCFILREVADGVEVPFRRVNGGREGNGHSNSRPGVGAPGPF